MASEMRRVAPANGRWLTGRWTPWAWAVASLVAYLAAPFAAIVLLTPFVPGDTPLGKFVMTAAWTLLAAGGVLLAARVSFRAWPRVSPEAAILLATGAAFAAAVDAALHAWASYRLGYIDVDLIGPTGIFFAVVVAVAVAGFGAMIAPRGAALPPLVAVVAGMALTAISLLGNLPGLADGLDPESVVPAAVIGGAAVYVVLVGLVTSLARLGASEPDR